MALTRTEKRIAKLREENERLTKRIKEDTLQKANNEKEIHRLESEALTSFLKANDMMINDELFRNLAITKKIVENGYTTNDLEQLFEVNSAMQEESTDENK